MARFSAASFLAATLSARFSARASARFSTSALRSFLRSTAADVASADEVSDADELVDAAERPRHPAAATPAPVKTAAPIPSATANPPTRPTYAPALIPRYIPCLTSPRAPLHHFLPMSQLRVIPTESVSTGPIDHGSVAKSEKRYRIDIGEAPRHWTRRTSDRSTRADAAIRSHPRPNPRRARADTVSFTRVGSQPHGNVSAAISKIPAERS